MNRPYHCKNCKFYEDQYDGATYGLCRINPPGARDSDGRLWPEVSGDDDWCGQIKPVISDEEEGQGK